MNAAKQVTYQQTPLEGFDVARLRITGISKDEITNPPELGDRMELRVLVECVERSVKMRAGELRPTATMEMIAMEIVAGPSAPTGEPNMQGSLFDDPEE